MDMTTLSGRDWLADGRLETRRLAIWGMGLLELASLAAAEGQPHALVVLLSTATSPPPLAISVHQHYLEPSLTVPLSSFGANRFANSNAHSSLQLSPMPVRSFPLSRLKELHCPCLSRLFLFPLSNLLTQHLQPVLYLVFGRPLS